MALRGRADENKRVKLNGIIEIAARSFEIVFFMDWESVFSPLPFETAAKSYMSSDVFVFTLYFLHNQLSWNCLGFLPTTICGLSLAVITYLFRRSNRELYQCRHNHIFPLSNSKGLPLSNLD